MKKHIFIFVTLLMFMVSTVFASDARYVLNSASLKPTLTNSKPCDDIIKDTLDRITNDSISTYDKIKACYDYLINTCSYGSNHSKAMFYEYVNGILVKGDSYFEIEDFGNRRTYTMLKYHLGVCDDYSCTFAALVRHICLNCYTIGGQTARASGEMTGGHIWTVINVDSVEYVFDPQIDDNIAKGDNIGYYRFCKTYNKLPGSYDDYKINYSYFAPFN